MDKKREERCPACGALRSPAHDAQCPALVCDNCGTEYTYPLTLNQDGERVCPECV